jgi:hypothetical protein
LAPIHRLSDKAEGVFLGLHGILQILPVSSLPIAALGALAASVELSVLPSLSFLQSLEQKPIVVSPQVKIVIGPEIRDESVAIAVAALDKRLGELEIEYSVTTSLAAASDEPGLTIIVAHGRTDSEPEILLYNSECLPEWLPGSKLAKAVNPRQIIAMAVCNSASSSIAAGNQPVGLVWNMLNAGFRTILGSLWEVEPVATANYVANFAASLLSGCSAGKANAVALRLQQESYQSIRDNSAFTLYGDFRSRLFTS